MEEVGVRFSLGPQIALNLFSVFKMNTDALGRILYESLARNEKYMDSLKIVRQNSAGAIWLIGSGVYKILLSALYGRTFRVKDWDFIVEKVSAPLKLENDWELAETKHGNPKLKRSDFVIDLISLDNIHSIKERSIEPSIENYLSGVPLTIQSIAFDISANKLLGDVGVQSILQRTVGVNNEAEYNYAAGIYGDRYSVKHYADALGLRVV